MQNHSSFSVYFPSICFTTDQSPLAALFHAAFFLFLRKKYLDWTETGRDIFFIGRRKAGFASGRFILEILLSVLVVIFTPLNILGFLAGLLSLVVATYG